MLINCTGEANLSSNNIFSVVEMNKKIILIKFDKGLSNFKIKIGNIYTFFGKIVILENNIPKMSCDLAIESNEIDFSLYYKVVKCL